MLCSNFVWVKLTPIQKPKAMNKQSELSFSNTSAELNVFHALMDHIKQEKLQSLIVLGQTEKSNKFVGRLKKRFTAWEI